MFLYLRIFYSFLLFNFFFANEQKHLRYRNWYRPWLLLLLILINLIFYMKIRNKFMGTNPGQMEIVYEYIFTFIVIGQWVALKIILSVFKVNEKVEKLLAKHNVNRIMISKMGYDNHLIWPYLSYQGKIVKRPGFSFFKTLLWTIVIILTLAYIWSAWKVGYTNFVIPNALSFLSILFFLEWIVYFSYKESKKNKVNEDAKAQAQGSNFDRVFKRFANKSTGFYDSILFGYSDVVSHDSKTQVAEKERYLNDNIAKIINDDSSLIISAPNFSDSLPQISEVLFDTLKKGGNILIVADIPNYISYNPQGNNIDLGSKSKHSVVQLLTAYMQQILEKEIPSSQNLMDIGYFSTKNLRGLDKRIVLSSIEDATSKELMHSEWMKELDLMIVFQFDDIYVNNLSKKRELSLWLQQQGQKFKIILLNDYRAGGDEAMSNIWVSSKDVPEAKLQNIQHAGINYFINFAYEYSAFNLNKILVGSPNEFGIAPGIELSVFPIMEGVSHIHYFEGYNLDYTQSKNKLENLQKSFKRDSSDIYLDYHNSVSQAKIASGIFVNNLPFILRPINAPQCEEAHFSVVFDIENNAPKLYNKYKHLGSRELFICVVSKPHLFREFFAEKISYFQASTIESLAPQLSNSKINLCLQLFNLLINEAIDMQFIRSQLNAYTVQLNRQSIIDYIGQLFKQYLHIDISKNAVLKSGSKYEFKNEEYHEVYTLKMDEQRLEANEIFEYMRLVQVMDYSRNLIMELPKYLLFQNFLPQQNIIIDGISYDFIQYDDLNHELILRTKPTDNFSFNKPKAKIHILEPNTIEEIDKPDIREVFMQGKAHRFSIEFNEALMETSYLGYYKFSRLYHSPYANNNTPKYIDLNDYENLIENSRRRYRTRFLHIRWQVAQKYQKRIPELCTRIHHLLFEFLPILFPYRYQYLQIVSNNELDASHRERIPWIFPENNFEYQNENEIELYIIEDSFADLGILKPLQSFFPKILSDLNTLLQWLLLDDKKNTETYSYLDHIKGKHFYQDKLTFLKYGLDENEINWNIKLLIEFLQNSNLFDADINKF